MMKMVKITVNLIGGTHQVYKDVVKFKYPNGDKDELFLLQKVPHYLNGRNKTT